MLEIKKGSSATTLSTPEQYTPITSIALDTEIVKQDFLKSLRLSKKIPRDDMVDCVKGKFSKFDEALFHKCEHGDKYGITLRREAFDAILDAFFSEEVKKAIKKRRRGGHKLTKRIQCRLTDETYDQLMLYIGRAGYTTVQDWLSAIVGRYIEQEQKYIHAD